MFNASNKPLKSLKRKNVIDKTTRNSRNTKKNKKILIDDNGALSSSSSSSTKPKHSPFKKSTGSKKNIFRKSIINLKRKSNAPEESENTLDSDIWKDDFDKLLEEENEELHSNKILRKVVRASYNLDSSLENNSISSIINTNKENKTEHKLRLNNSNILKTKPIEIYPNLLDINEKNKKKTKKNANSKKTILTKQKNTLIFSTPTKKKPSNLFNVALSPINNNTPDFLKIKRIGEMSLLKAKLNLEYTSELDSCHREIKDMFKKNYSGSTIKKAAQNAGLLNVNTLVNGNGSLSNAGILIKNIDSDRKKFSDNSININNEEVQSSSNPKFKITVSNANDDAINLGNVPNILVSNSHDSDDNIFYTSPELMDNNLILLDNPESLLIDNVAEKISANSDDGQNQINRTKNISANCDDNHSKIDQNQAHSQIIIDNNNVQHTDNNIALVPETTSQGPAIEDLVEGNLKIKENILFGKRLLFLKNVSCIRRHSLDSEVNIYNELNKKNNLIEQCDKRRATVCPISLIKRRRSNIYSERNPNIPEIQIDENDNKFKKKTIVALNRKEALNSNAIPNIPDERITVKEIELISQLNKDISEDISISHVTTPNISDPVYQENLERSSLDLKSINSQLYQQSLEANTTGTQNNIQNNVLDNTNQKLFKALNAQYHLSLLKKCKVKLKRLNFSKIDKKEVKSNIKNKYKKDVVSVINLCDNENSLIEVKKEEINGHGRLIRLTTKEKSFEQENGCCISLSEENINPESSQEKLASNIELIIETKNKRQSVLKNTNPELFEDNSAALNREYNLSLMKKCGIKLKRLDFSKIDKKKRKSNIENKNIFNPKSKHVEFVINLRETENSLLEEVKSDDPNLQKINPYSTSSGLSTKEYDSSNIFTKSEIISSNVSTRRARQNIATLTLQHVNKLLSNRGEFQLNNGNLNNESYITLRSSNKTKRNTKINKSKDLSNTNDKFIKNISNSEHHSLNKSSLNKNNNFQISEKQKRNSRVDISREQLKEKQINASSIIDVNDVSFNRDELINKINEHSINTKSVYANSIKLMDSSKENKANIFDKAKTDLTETENNFYLLPSGKWKRSISNLRKEQTIVANKTITFCESTESRKMKEKFNENKSNIRNLSARNSMLLNKSRLNQTNLKHISVLEIVPETENSISQAKLPRGGIRKTLLLASTDDDSPKLAECTLFDNFVQKRTKKSTNKSYFTQLESGEINENFDLQQNCNEKSLLQYSSIRNQYNKQFSVPLCGKQKSFISTRCTSVIEKTTSEEDLFELQDRETFEQKSNFIRPISLDISLLVQLNPKDNVLRHCNQIEPLEFSNIYSEKILNQCRKIGEGVYGEVFMNKNRFNSEVTVLKIIPIEGSIEINGEIQKNFEQILPEIIIAKELSNLRYDNKSMTSGFVEVKNIHCVQGKYPDFLIDKWELYEDNHGTENDHPKVFSEDQLYVVFELANAGQDLESYKFQNAAQTYSVFSQIALSLAVAENKYKFEHRDLHWGNVLVSSTDEKQLIFKLNGKDIIIETNGVKATIIDYTLSRMIFDGCCLYNDLSNDNELFSATGDYQYDIYRLMKKTVNNDWGKYDPYTNVLWLHYIIDKIISGVHCRQSKTKKHCSSLNIMKVIRDVLLDYKSASDYVENFGNNNK